VGVFETGEPLILGHGVVPAVGSTARTTQGKRLNKLGLTIYIQRSKSLLKYTGISLFRQKIAINNFNIIK